MAQNMPLSLKGLDPELREAAREAARRAGLSPTEWLETVIRGQAGFADDDGDEDDRELEARLSRLARGPAPRRERPRAGGGLRDRSDAPELEALVTHAARLDARTRETETKTTTALESILHWIERTEDRMAANEREASARQERATAVIADAIKTVSSRVAEVERRAAPARPAPADARAPGPRLAFSRDNLAAAVSDIRARQHALASGSGPQTPQVDRRSGERRADVTPAMNDIRSDIARLRDEIGRITRQPVATGLEESIRDLARKLETREQAALPDDLSRPLARIEAEMARLGSGGGDERFTRVERELGRLGERIEALATKAGEPRLLAAAVNEIATLKKQMNGGGPARLDELSGQIAALARDMGAVREEIARGGGRAPFEAALQDMREALARDSRELSGIGHGLMQRIAHQLDVVANAVSSMPAGRMGEDDRAEIAALSRKLDQLAQRTEPESGEMARRIESLAIKLEDLSRIGSEELLGRVDRLSEQLEVLTTRGPAAIEKQIDTLAARIETLAKSSRLEAVTQGATIVDLAPLEGMIGDLARRMDEAARPDAGTESLKALEAQIATLTERLDRQPARPSGDALERTLQDLMRSLGGLREETASAVDRAARAAVAEAIGHGSIGQGQGHAPGSDDLHLLRQDLAGLRDIHSSIDNRTHSAIGAVNDTLEKIVSRLAQLEDDIQRDRSPPAAPPPAFDLAPAHPEPAPQPRPARPMAQPLAASAPVVSGPAAEEPRRAMPAAPGPVSAPAATAPAPLDLAQSAADQPLEPGSGRPRARAEAPVAAAPLNPNLIAAARRAAQAAGIEAGALKADALKADPKARPDGKGEAKAKGGSLQLSLRETLEKRRKPILLGLAAIVLAIGAGQVATTMLADPPAPANKVSTTRSETRERAPDQAAAPAAAPAPATPAPAAQALPPKDQQSLAQPDAQARREQAVETTSSVRPAPEAAPARAESPGVSPQRVTNLGDLPANLGTAGMRRAALEGDANAVHELAARAADGVGSARDPRLALRLFERAAAAGHAPSQFRLGNIHEKGIGAPRDAKLASSWYRRAADQGNAKAMHNLAVLIAEGVEGRPDYAAAADLFRKAAEFGVRDSQYNLAILLGRGLGVEQDLVQSYAWFAIAARGGDADAARKRDEVGSKLAGADAAAANSLVLSWRPKTPDPVANEIAAPAEGWDPQPRQTQPRAQQPRPRST